MRLFQLFGILSFSSGICLPTLASEPAPLPNSHIAIGENQVAKTWLANPTTRYQHYVLGDRYEASSLVVEHQNGEVLQYDLPSHLVFEDRHVRLADLNNNGDDELIVVMSSLLQGAALAVFEVDHDIRLLAQTPHIGLPFRWLNPAGIADYDGDGSLEIALVQKPHLTKRLEFWRLDGSSLERVAALDGFSNHRNGSRNQLMSTTIDVNNDGIPDLLIPGLNRQSLIAVTLTPSPSVTKQWALPAQVDGDFARPHNNTTHPLRLTLQNGKSFEVDLQ